MENRITFLPGTGLDWDSDIDALAPGDGRYRLNVNIEEGHILGVTNVMGNASQSKSLPNGTNKITGWKEDTENNALVFCVYNSNNDHCIIRYNYDGTFDDISYAESFWNLQSDKIVSIDFVGEGDDQQMVLTDNHNPPRKFNVADIEGGTTPVADNSNLAKEVYENIHSFGIGPIVGKTFGPSTYLNLKNKLFQFRYKKVYASGEESPWSHVINDAISEKIYIEERAGIGDAIIGVGHDDIAAYLSISSLDCDKVKISFRYGDIGTGVWSVWYLADVVDPNETTTYYFLNDKHYQPLDNEVGSDINLNYYNVPHAAKRVLTSGGNRIALLGPTIGYDPVDLDVTIEHETNTPDFDPFDTFSFAQMGGKPVAPSATSTTISPVSSGGSFNLFRIRIKKSSGSPPSVTPSTHVPESYIMIKSGTSEEIADYFTAKINAETNLNINVNDLGASGITIDNNESDSIYIIYEYISSQQPKKTIKGGQRIELALAYYDNENRSTAALVSEDTGVYIEDMNEFSGGGTSHHFLNFIKYTISHTPPSWATHYQWLYGGGSIQRYFSLPLAINITSEEHINYEDDSLTNYNDGLDYEHDGGFTYINLPQAKARIHSQYPHLQIDYFDLIPGDMVRFVAERDTADINFKNIGQLIEIPILDIKPDGRIMVRDIRDLSIDITSYEIVLAEFYRPRNLVNTEDLVYYEIGRPIPISGGYHQAYAPTWSGVTAQNQTGAQDAIGVIDWWDSYLKIQEYFIWYNNNGVNNMYTCFGTIESQSMSYLYPSRIFPIGRPNIIDPNFKQRKLKAVVWGGSYSEDGIVFNELNKFVSKNIRFLEDKYGSVYGMEETGDVITILQREKVSSMGVGVDEVTNQDGTGSLVAIQNAFGNIRKFREEAGTVFSNSVVNNGTHVYFFDIYAHKLFRRAYNGLFPISDYKMSAYFKAKSEALLESGISNVDVVCGWDGYNKVLYVTFIDSVTPANNQSIAFHEPTNRWFTFVSFIPDLYARIGDNGFYTFKNNILYKHNLSSVLRNNFYGSQYSSYVDVVLGGLDTKRFRTLKVNSTDKWEAPDEDGIEIGDDEAQYTDVESNQVYDGTMKSSLPANQFEYDRGDYKADFLRDATTTTGSYSSLDLHRGRPLKGKSIKVKLKNSNTSKTVLKSASIKWTQK